MLNKFQRECMVIIGHVFLREIPRDSKKVITQRHYEVQQGSENKVYIDVDYLSQDEVKMHEHYLNWEFYSLSTRSAAQLQSRDEDGTSGSIVIDSMNRDEISGRDENNKNFRIRSSQEKYIQITSGANSTEREYRLDWNPQ